MPYLYDASRVPGYDDMLLWQTEFWNRDLGTVVRLGPTVRDSLPEDTGSIDPVTGRIATGVGSPRYVVATNGLVVAGIAGRLEGRADAVPRGAAAPARALGGEGVYADGSGCPGGERRHGRRWRATPGDRPGTLQVQLSRMPGAAETCPDG